MDELRDSQEPRTSRAGPEVAGAGTDGVDAAVARWQSQLLQLNRSNNLLYFKANTTPNDPNSGRRASIRCVPITGFSPDEIDDYLQRARRGRTFDFARRPRRRRGSGLGPPTNEPAEPIDEIEFVRGDLPTDIEPLALQQLLRRFLRKEREWMEEQGINVLFLAAGLLEWIDEEREAARAPLLLLPCDLQQSSPREPFVLRREDDDATANATLRHKLRQFDITLPEFNHETYAAYLEEVTDLVRGRDGWRVTCEVVLSTFQYTKLAMWEDLDQMRSVGVSHLLVRQLAGELLTTDANADAPRDVLPSDSELVGGRLDDILDLRQEVTVLPADHSQLRAVAAARAGENLVIHGPPGTGKSQTIVNIISNLLADGKRVLFVSEKSVALDVVKNRLDQQDLGVFCLDMHSDRASKTSVYEQLRSSIEDSGHVTRFDYSHEDLQSTRSILNEVVRSLHETRQPLGRSVYQINGQYASVRDLPDVEFPVPGEGKLDESQLREISALAERIARRPEEFRDLTTSKWKSLKVHDSTVGLADRLRRDADTAFRAVQRAETLLREKADLLGVPAPEDSGDASKLGALARHLGTTPLTSQHWLNSETPAALRRVATEQREQQRRARTLADRASKAFGGQAPEADYQQLSRSARPTLAEIGALREALGANWATRLLPDPALLLDDATRLEAAVAGLIQALDELAAQLRSDSPSTSWPESSRMMDFARQLGDVATVPDAWTDLDHLAEVRRLTGAARAAHQALNRAETKFYESYDPELVDSVDREMLVRFRIDHQSGLRRHVLGRAAYKRDLRLLRGHARVPGRMVVAGWLSVVERAIEIQSLRRDWEAAYAAIEPHIGSDARSRETDWTQIEVHIDRLEGLLQSWPWQQDRLLRLLTSRADLQELHDAEQAAQAGLQSLNASSQNLQSDRLDLSQIGPEGILATIQQALAPIARLEEAMRSVIAELTNVPADWLAFSSLIDDLARLQDIQEDEGAAQDDLRRSFGEWFCGRDTDWDGVMDAIQWCQGLLDLVNDRPSKRLLELVRSEDLSLKPNRAAKAIEALQSGYPDDLGVLDSRFNVSVSPWTSWETAPFAALRDWLASVHEDADGATGWIEFTLAVDGLERILGPGTIQRIRDATDDAVLVPGIVNRRLHATWLDAVIQEDPRLRDFTARDHEALRHRFQNLDRQLPRVLRERTRTALFERYPKAQTGATRSGQLGVLRGELTKRRRQMSVRQLLAAAPQLIQALKPCFLMSPLAVSQYLERTGATSANLHFDTVIFDESSQVLPEDAVPAISRANQTIVVGDRRQLPPTTLFQRRYEHEDDDDGGDDETDWFEGRESILDVMVGMVGSGVDEHYLGVHYRSQHDSLIRYSNHFFYDDRLLTFPSPGKTATLGVRSVYLPNGRYASGTSRDNRIEAEKVVELVFELMRTSPESESVGVVALNRPQASLIEDLIERRLDTQPELEFRFSSEREERFFVKNLENVQGDERDHMVLSIGYGPTATGKVRVRNRFGPINNEGGERRLNVAVSRARRSMTIVHSLRPEDIGRDAQRFQSRGAQLLRRYLEFARSPNTALAYHPSVGAQTETTRLFEETVGAALVKRGHKVDVGVGASGYPIDLAIKAEDGEGYALGIECDGATYHSAPAARDRDWLRQSVLEGLGWKIHRVWSRAWIQNPERELEAIEQSLSESEALLDDSNNAVDAPEIEDDSELKQQRRISVVSNEDREQHPADDSGEQPEVTESISGENERFEPYEVADLSKYRVGRELRQENVSKLCELITEVVRVEGPVHRDVVLERVRRRFRASRMRGATRQRFLSAIRTAAHGSLSWLPEEEESSGATAQYVFLIDPAASESITPRAPTDGAPRRRIEQIALCELKAGILVCAELLYGAGRDDLIAETARQFGYRRTRKDIASRIEKAVDQLIHAGKLTGDAQMLTVTD